MDPRDSSDSTPKEQESEYQASESSHEDDKAMEIALVLEIDSDITKLTHRNLELENLLCDTPFLDELTHRILKLEKQLRDTNEVSPDDVKFAMLHGNCTRAQAVEALEKHREDPLGAVRKAISSVGDTDGVDPDDVKLVMLQGNCTRAQAVEAIKKHTGDLLGAILEVQGTIY